MKATERYFPVVLFNMLCKVVLTFESVKFFPVVLFISLYKVVLDLKSYKALFCCDVVYSVVQFFKEFEQLTLF